MKLLQYLLLSILVFGLTGCVEPDPQDNPDTGDTEPPVVSLYGENPTYVYVNKDYLEYGASATDNVDEDVEIIQSGDVVDTSIAGTYIIEYGATDEAGNQAESVSRTVYVVNREPGILSSIVYESYDRVGFLVDIFDHNDALVELYARMYDGDVLINEWPLEDGTNSFEFVSLEPGVDYEYLITGTYDLGGGLGLETVERDSILVGTYRRLDETIREDINNDELFYAIQDLVWLPYNSHNDVISERMVMHLAKVDPELVIGVSTYTPDRLILTDGFITSVYDYFYLKGEEARGTGTTFDQIPGVCCDPMVVKIGYQGKSLNILLHEFGHSVDIMLFGWISGTDAFLEIQQLEKETMFGDDEYMNYPEEYFAESFAFYYHSDATRAELYAKAPQTHDFIANLLQVYEDMYGDSLK